MNTYSIYKKFKNYPLGNKLFMKAVCLKAPYFSTISPELLNYQKGEIKIRMKKKRSLYNHIGTIHAIAMCNLAELCAGMTLESALAKNLRWIPKGMQVEYLKKAETDLIGHCFVKPTDIQTGDNTVVVEITNTLKEIVFRANVNMYVSERKS